MTRAEKVAEAQRLRGEGLLLREIAERMGSTLKTVHTWLADPDLSRQRARRRGYGRKCVDCGALTDGSNGRAKAPERCESCFHRCQHLRAVADAIAAIRCFASRYGRPPSATDFNPALARTNGQEWRAKRYYDDGDYPAAATVVRAFGSWNAAIEAAGFSPRARGTYPRLAGGGARGAHLEAERDAA